MGLIRTALRAVLLPALLALHPQAAVARVPTQTSAQAGAEDGRLLAVMRDDSRRAMAVDPLGALFHGGAVSGDELAQIFTDAQLRAARKSGAVTLEALARIDRAALSPERRISYDAFLAAKREEQDWLRPDLIALTAVRPLEHFGGLHMEFPALLARDGAIPFESEADYRRNLGVNRAFATVLDNAVLRFRQGLDSGVVDTRLTVRNMIAQIDTLLAHPPEQSPFYAPVTSFPDTVPASRRAPLRSAYAATIRDDLYPAYRRLRDFLNDEYLPAARDSVGLSGMKGGNALYRKLIERETTLKLEPEKVHALGLTEVARIQREMDAVRERLGYTGDLKAFFEHIRTDPRFHPTSEDELARGYADVARKVEALAPRYFHRLPRTPLVIQPYPAYRAQYEAGGSYTQGSADGRRPGIFWYNTHDLPSRFLSGVTTLYLHEGAPGHHFQISRAQEDTSLPDIQRFGGNDAYVEGWALYAETLGFAMGLYDDPLQHWGTLDDEMLRAMRLVVDTGIHAKGWSRDQAIEYMLANSGMGRTDATAEVERYIAWPAQALSYKIGALTIQNLRSEAETALGARFDIRDFHEQVLGSGALPLPILEAKVRGWITRQR